MGWSGVERGVVKVCIRGGGVFNNWAGVYLSFNNKQGIWRFYGGKALVFNIGA